MNRRFPISSGVVSVVASLVMMTSLGCGIRQPRATGEPEETEVKSEAKAAEPPKPPPPPPKSVATLVEELQIADTSVAFGIVKELGDRGSEAKEAAEVLTQKLRAINSELNTIEAERAAAQEWRVLVFDKDDGFESTTKWRRPTREDIGRGARIIGKNEVIMQRELQDYRFVREEAPDTSELDNEIQLLTYLRDALVTAVEQIGPTQVDEPGEEPTTDDIATPAEPVPANESVVQQDEAQPKEIQLGKIQVDEIQASDTPEKGIPPTEIPLNEARQWTDITGNFKVRATFQGITEDGKSVRLTREDSGKTITITLEKLSEADQTWVSQKK